MRQEAVALPSIDRARGTDRDDVSDRNGIGPEYVARITAAYADRLHDAVRRAGCSPAAAYDVLRQALVATIVALDRGSAKAKANANANPNANANDLLSSWLRHAEAMAARRGEQHDPPDEDAEEHRGRAALAQLEPDSRRVLMLRDGYDLPPATVAACCDTDVAGMRRRVFAARLGLLASYDARPGPEPGDESDCPLDTGELAALTDHTLPPSGSVVLRRHAYRCPRCDDVIDAQERARRIVARLPLLRMDPTAGMRLVDAAAAAAEERLSPLDALFVGPAPEASHEQGRPLSAALAGFALSLSLLAGVVAGLADGRRPHPSPATALVTPGPSPSTSCTPQADPREVAIGAGRRLRPPALHC